MILSWSRKTSFQQPRNDVFRDQKAIFYPPKHRRRSEMSEPYAGFRNLQRTTPKPTRPTRDVMNVALTPTDTPMIASRGWLW
jgi:hypothetical protein